MSHTIYLQNGHVFCQHVTLANTFIKRFAGLMLTKALPPQHGLLIHPCNQVHSHFMRYAIDVIFLDESLNVRFILTNMKPWRFSKIIKEAKYVLEVPAFHADVLRVSDQLILKVTM